MIEFDRVAKTYPDGTQAVQELSLTLPSDGVSVIVGPSGCGKTTTLRMINRMIEPTAGEIRWDGVDIRAMKKTELRRKMGYVIQNGGLFPHRSVLENIATVPNLLHWDRARIRERGMQLLELVGLESRLAGRFPAQLSGGQQQRVGVARALAADPVLLLMDEPFSAVDPVVRGDLQQLVLRLQRELHKTIVMITHDIDEAITLGDRVAILAKGGRLAQAGTPRELLEDPADDFVANFVGRDRGFRALTFHDGSSLEVASVSTARDPHTRPTPGRPVLLLDRQSHPAGWLVAETDGAPLPIGSSFEPSSSSLRSAMDAVLGSPVGLGVAVDAEGRFRGVVAGATVLAAVQSVRLRNLVEDARADRHRVADPAPRSPETEPASERRAPAETEPSPETGSSTETEPSPPAEAAAKPEAAAEPEAR